MKPISKLAVCMLTAASLSACDNDDCTTTLWDYIVGTEQPPPDDRRECERRKRESGQKSPLDHSRPDLDQAAAQLKQKHKLPDTAELHIYRCQSNFETNQETNHTVNHTGIDVISTACADLAFPVDTDKCPNGLYQGVDIIEIPAESLIDIEGLEDYDLGGNNIVVKPCIGSSD